MEQSQHRSEKGNIKYTKLVFKSIEIHLRFCNFFVPLMLLSAARDVQEVPHNQQNPLKEIYYLLYYFFKIHT